MPVPLPQIRPISDLRTDLNGICDLAESSAEPIFLTKNGHPKLVVLSSGAYEEMQQRARYVQKLREAEIEAHYQKDPVSSAEVEADLQRIFDVWGV